MTENDKRRPRRQYPSLYEKLVPITLVAIAIAVIALLIIIIGVALGLFSGA